MMISQQNCPSLWEADLAATGAKRLGRAGVREHRNRK